MNLTNPHVNYLMKLRREYLDKQLPLPPKEAAALCDILQQHGGHTLVANTFASIYCNGGKPYLGEKPFDTLVATHGATHVIGTFIGTAFHALLAPDLLEEGTCELFQNWLAQIPEPFVFQHRHDVAEVVNTQVNGFRAAYRLSTRHNSATKTGSFEEYVDSFEKATNQWLTAVTKRQAQQQLQKISNPRIP